MSDFLRGRKFRCVVVDLNTQRDYVDHDGAQPVANLAELIGELRNVVAWAKRNHAPVISSIESHRPSDLESNRCSECCMDGTTGQSKIDFTLFSRSICIEVDNTLACPHDLFKKYQQVIFRKRSDDLLANPKADRFFNLLPPCEFILFGVGVEQAIKALALGLLAREKRVTVVADACGYWNKSTADLALRQMAAKGVRVMTVADLMARKLDRRSPYPMVSRRTGLPTSGTGGNGFARDALGGNGLGGNGRGRPSDLA